MGITVYKSQVNFYGYAGDSECDDDGDGSSLGLWASQAKKPG